MTDNSINKVENSKVAILFVKYLVQSFETIFNSLLRGNLC
jgi:hypothetical protein